MHLLSQYTPSQNTHGYSEVQFQRCLGDTFQNEERTRAGRAKEKLFVEGIKAGQKIKIIL
jgi:hypothetical protein